jgi:peptidoglycan glycosyltransferase
MAFILFFVGMIAYLAYFTSFERKKISVHPSNRRLDHLESEIVRGTIYDTNGVVLAITENDQRKYPFGSLYAHSVGYANQGKNGAEALVNTELLYPDYTLKSIFENAFFEEPFMGRDVVLTIEHTLQQSAEEGLKNKKGAVVILEASTGKIFAMYSNPTFNPNNLSSNWEYLIKDDVNSPLVNRVTQGLYPPGSIFKILPSIAYLQNEFKEPFTHVCEGSITKGEHTIRCFNGTAHGEVDLKAAFEKSCNTYFIALEEYISPQSLQNLAEKLLFNKTLPTEIETSKSRLSIKGEDSFNVLASYMGQGKTLVSPMHMAMLSSLIINDGVLMEPYIFDYSMSKKGSIRLKNLPSYHSAYLQEEITTQMQQMMIGVVEKGTATAIKRSDIIIGGKTGTAQNETSEDHSWFVGFAYPENRKEEAIAFAVIVENGGKGAQALNVTRTIIDAYAKTKK